MSIDVFGWKVKIWHKYSSSFMTVHFYYWLDAEVRIHKEMIGYPVKHWHTSHEDAYNLIRSRNKWSLDVNFIPIYNEM